MNYQVFLLARAQKNLDGFGGKTLSALCKLISNLSKNPRPLGSLKLTGEEGYRIRVGAYRVLYRIDDKEKKLYIYRVGHRREVYR